MGGAELRKKSFERYASTVPEPSGEQSPWSAEGVPRREVRDPRVLRAMAHPVRWQILDQLLVHGPATATELAERLDESPSNCSWHLRQLAKYGFIEPAEGGTGRQRPWRFVPQTTGIAPSDGDVEFSHARDVFIEFMLTQDLAALRAWQQSRHRESEQWREAGFVNSSNYIWLTADEVNALEAELSDVVERHLAPHVERVNVDRRPAGSRPIRFAAWAVPTGPPHPGEPGRPPQPGEPAKPPLPGEPATSPHRDGPGTRPHRDDPATS